MRAAREPGLELAVQQTAVEALNQIPKAKLAGTVLLYILLIHQAPRIAHQAIGSI